MSSSLPQRVLQTLEAEKLPSGIRLFIVRRDGMLVWDAQPDHQSQSLAALCGGVWEASMAMAGAGGMAKKKDGFRLVFDDSEEGVLVFPLNIEKQTYYLGGIYRSCVNPGKLRHQVQELRARLDVSFAHLKPLAEQRQTHASNRDEYLFKDITDEEMDRLFGLGR